MVAKTPNLGNRLSPHGGFPSKWVAHQDSPASYAGRGEPSIFLMLGHDCTSQAWVQELYIRGVSDQNWRLISSRSRSSVLLSHNKESIRSGSLTTSFYEVQIYVQDYY
jgi:hypothetical protein